MCLRVERWISILILHHLNIDTSIDFVNVLVQYFISISKSVSTSIGYVGTYCTFFSYIIKRIFYYNPNYSQRLRFDDFRENVV